VAHRDVVGVALERVGLDQLDAADLSRFELDVQAVLAILEPGTAVIGVLWVGKLPPPAPAIRPDWATYTRAALSSSSTKPSVLPSTSFRRGKAEPTSVPPSVSNVSVSKSVETTRRCLPTEGVLAGTAPGAAATAGVAAGAGTAPLPTGPAGTLAVEAGAAAGAVLLATGVGEGKNVALLPLKSCHWSHNRTMEKPKITHRMVRRMSFMTASF
jgi:hypothetical protein